MFSHLAETLARQFISMRVVHARSDRRPRRARTLFSSRSLLATHHPTSASASALSKCSTH